MKMICLTFLGGCTIRGEWPLVNALGGTDGKTAGKDMVYYQWNEAIKHSVVRPYLSQKI